MASGPGVVRLEHRETRAPAGPGHPRLSTGQTDRNNRKTASRPRSSLGYRERKKNFGLPGARKNFGLPGARKNFGLPGARKIFGLPGARRSSVAEGLFFCCSCPSGRCLSVGTQALLVIGFHGAPAGRLLRTAGVAMTLLRYAQGRTLTLRVCSARETDPSMEPPGGHGHRRLTLEDVSSGDGQGGLRGILTQAWSPRENHS